MGTNEPTTTHLTSTSASGDLYGDIGRRRRKRHGYETYKSDELNADNAGNVPFAVTEPEIFVFEVRDAVIALLCAVNVLLLTVLFCRTKKATRGPYAKVSLETDTEMDDE